MYTFQNIILFFGYILTYILSSYTKVTKIESTSELILGEIVKFNLTVQDYDSDDEFYLGDEIDSYQIYLKNCSLQNDNILTCDANLDLNELIYLKNLTKTLYVYGRSTNLTVTINKPKILKLLDFDNYEDNYFYSYGVSKFIFEVNFNELYNSSISIKFGDIAITKCEKSKEYNDINCEYEFPESCSGKTLNLIFNGIETNYSITINAPNEFSEIRELKNEYYYSSSSSQFIYFRVDSSYNMNNHKIELVPETSGNKNISLNECTHDEDGIRYAKCLGILDTNDAYYVYFDGVNSEEKLYVYPEPTTISQVYDISPYEFLASSSEITFTLEVNYVVNIENAVFTLVDKYNSNNKFYLTKCSKSDNSYNEITCSGKVTNPGYYYVYLNGLKQDEPYRIKVYSSSLTKALYVEPDIIKFESATESEYIEIFFDSINNIEQKSIMLKGENNKKEIKLEIDDDVDSYGTEFEVEFPAEDTYYLYIDNVKQNVYIEVRKKDFTSIATSISPNIISTNNDEYIPFTLTVDTNFGIADVDIYLTWIGENYKENRWLNCEPDSSDNTKAICLGRFYEEGEYYLNVNETEFKDLTVTAKKVPRLINYSPISISPSLNSISIILYFKEDISSYVNKIAFVGAETLTPTCELSSNYALICSAVFKNEDKYFITIDGANIGRFINVNTKDNDNEYNINDESGSSNDDDNDDNCCYANYINKIKYISLILVLLL